MKAMIITIDGPAGSGKSTVAARLADKLGIFYLDTGAMYRAVTLAALENETNLEDEAALAALARQCRIEFQHDKITGQSRVLLNGRDITEQIRQVRITEQAHYIARSRGVREILVDAQRQIAREMRSLVSEGRDQGTVVFPGADFKFYLDASAQCRARRRQEELQKRGTNVNLEDLLAMQQQRDQRDATRKVGPLKPAPDSVRLDTTNMSIDEVVDNLYQHITEGR